MAGQIKVDNINADSNLALKIANTAVAYIDSTGLKPVSGNLVVGGTQVITNGTITANSIANSSFQTGSIENYMNAAGLGFGMRNRIINGAMAIDQRNAGAAVTINTTANIYTLDRWNASGQVTDGVFTVQRSTTAPTGFTNSLLVTVTTADASIGAGQVYVLTQFIEGFNTADLMWGTVNAKTITLSFWVRSSVTGTFSGALNNSDNTRSYPFTYVINSANTYEYKTVTITGDTTGTWLIDSGRGVNVRFSLGTGSTNSGTAGAWSGSTLYAATGSVNLISTLNATFYLTGVQLELGSAATTFDFRAYGTELALCQRYYHSKYTRVPSVSSDGLTCYFPVSMRTTPTIAGGGSGFISSTSTNEVLYCYQTTAAYQTLTFSSEL